MDFVGREVIPTECEHILHSFKFTEEFSETFVDVTNYRHDKGIYSTLYCKTTDRHICIVTLL